MNRPIRVFLILLTLSLAVAAPLWCSDALWQLAVETYTRNSNLTPGRMLVQVVQYNGRGHVVSEMESEMAISLDENGEIVTEVIYTRGELEPQEEGENADGGPFGQDGGGSFAGLNVSPFDPEQQEVVSADRDGPQTWIEGVAVIPYHYEHQANDEALVVGTAWLSADDGTPVRLSYTIDPLPRFLRSFEVSQSYSDVDGEWTLGEILIEVDARFLFVRRLVESRMEFSDYFRSEE
jgi:hypothetical protein